MLKYFIIILLVSGVIFCKSQAQEYNSYLIRYKGDSQKLISEMNKIGIKCDKTIEEKYTKQNDNNRFLSNLQATRLSQLSYYYTVSASDFVQISQMYNYLKSDENFISLEPNYIYKISQDNIKPNDSLYQDLWWLQAVNTEKAWKKASGNGVIIGLIDTGIDFEHPDLMENLWVNPKEDINGNGKFDAWSVSEFRNGISGDLNGIDDDGNGYIDDVIGYDFVDQSVVNFGDYSIPDPIPDDQGEHGTLVAGVMSGIRNNKIGISGIAYKSKILTAKAFDITGNAESDDIARAIIYAVLNGARVLNFSFGERNESPIVYDAIKFAKSMGCVMIASSGNNGWNFQHYPSDHPEVISVGGIDPSGRSYGRANYGSMLDIVAPAVNILTTDIRGGYKITNGTSLAAPIVSAASALLLEINSDVKSEEIKGILQMSARREILPKWSVNYGSGIVNIGEAVNSTNASTFAISYPNHEQIINKDETSEIIVRGTALSILFDSFDITLGQGIMPNQWILTSEKKSDQVNDSELGRFDISNLKDGIYTISLRVYQKNLNIIEERIYINIMSDSSKTKLISFNTKDVYYNDKRAVLLGAVTDRKCNLIIKYSPKDSNEEFVTRQFDFNSEYHTILIEDGIIPEIEYNAKALFYTDAGDTTIKDFTFTRKNDIFQTSNFIRKNYTLNRTYLLNDVTDLYNNRKKHIAINDLSTLFIGEARIYEFDENSFKLKDTSKEGWISAGFGDSNGDGIPEIFATSDGISTLKQAENLGENPFGKEIYRSPLDSTFWAEQIFDIDGDGIDELIGYKYDNANGNYYAVYKFISGKYQLVYKTELPGTLKNVSLTRGAQIADFDGDGKYELVFANTRGHLFIYEYSLNRLNLEFVDSVSKASSVQFIQKPDIDGDGIPEIFQTYAGSYGLFEQNEVGSPIWTARIIKSLSPNNYSTDIWTDDIYGVRIGSTRQGAFYRNGASSGDLNADGNDEIILSVFPNLYVWTWDNNSKKMKPFWYYPTTLSNTALIYDFDNNGVNEIGISTFSNTSFFEFNKEFKGPNVAKNFDGWALSQTSAYFKWDLDSSVKEYVLFYVDRTTNQPQAIEQARTSENEIVLHNLIPDKYYEFVLASFNPDLIDKFSDFSDIVEIYTLKLTKAVNVNVISSNQISVNFNGKLTGNYLNPELFEIYDEQNSLFSYAKSIIVSSDTSVIISVDNKLDSGNYFLAINTFRDYYGNPIEKDKIPFEYIKDKTEDELYLMNLNFISETLLKIKFSEKVEIESAQIDENYTMSPIGRVLYAEVDPTDNQYVLLNLSQEIRNSGARGKNYTITAKNIISQSGKNMTKGAGNTLGFVISNENLRDVYVYPNPIKQSENPEIFFANLTNRAVLTIMTTDGSEILSLIETDGNGGIEWNGRDKNGNLLPTGIYLFKVSGTNSDGLNVFEETGKFVILP